MKSISYLIALVLLPVFVNASEDDAKWGYCGTIHRRTQGLTLTTKDETFLLRPSDDYFLEQLHGLDGKRRCFLGEVRGPGHQHLSMLYVYDMDDFNVSRTIADCRATDVSGDNPFEEGFSVEEYPEVKVTHTSDTDDMEEMGLKLDIGSAQPFRVSNGDKISIDRRGAKLKITATRSESKDRFVIEINKTATPHGRKKVMRKKGDITFNDQWIADIVCK